MSTEDNVRQAVAKFIEEELNYSGPLDVDLIKGGVLDSMNLLRVVGFIEKTLKLPVDDEDLNPDNFRSLQTIVAYILRLQGGEAKA
jgi:acyl carrier protein